jgi:hypothetical protein
LFQLCRRYQQWRFGCFSAEYAATFEPQNTVGSGDRFGAMRDDDASDLQLAQRRVDLAFRGQIEVARPFVHEPDSRAAVESPRKEQALPLASRQTRPEVADQCAVIHRHRHDLGVNAGDSSALTQPRNIYLRVKEGNVFGDRAAQRVVLLHNDADLSAEDADARPVEPHVVDENLTVTRPQ